MSNLSKTYSKTPKGLRARSSLIGGLSGQLMKVLSSIDGISKAETILAKVSDINEDKLIAALTKLENEGYIKPIEINIFNDDDWSFGSDFAPMVVEEFKDHEEVNAIVQASTEEITRLENERQNKEAEKAKQKEAVIKAIQKAKAEEKVHEQLELERTSREAAETQKKLQTEAIAKAKAAQLEAERIVKAQEEARQNAALAAQKLAQANAEKAKLIATENTRLEKERLAQEVEAKKAAQASQILAERIVKVDESTRLAAEKAAKAEQLRLAAETQKKAQL